MRAGLLGRDRASALCAEAVDRVVDSKWGTAKFLLRGRTVRLRSVPGDHRARSRLCCGGAEFDAAQAWGSGEDGPAGRVDSCAVAPVGGLDGCVGAGSGAGSDTGSNAGGRGHEGAGTEGTQLMG